VNIVPLVQVRGGDRRRVRFQCRWDVVCAPRGAGAQPGFRQPRCVRRSRLLQSVPRRMRCLVLPLPQLPSPYAGCAPAAWQWVDADMYDGDALKENPRAGEHAHTRARPTRRVPALLTRCIGSCSPPPFVWAGYSVPGAKSGPVPIIRMFGVTDAGNSVCAHVHGFTPYFWCNPPPGMRESDVGAWAPTRRRQGA